MEVREMMIHKREFYILHWISVTNIFPRTNKQRRLIQRTCSLTAMAGSWILSARTAVAVLWEGLFAYTVAAKGWLEVFSYPENALISAYHKEVLGTWLLLQRWSTVALWIPVHSCTSKPRRTNTEEQYERDGRGRLAVGEVGFQKLRMQFSKWKMHKTTGNCNHDHTG